MLEKRAQIAPPPNGKCRLDKGFKGFVRNYLLIDLFKKQSYFGRSELRNLNEGCKDLPSPDRHHLPREGKKIPCAEHTVKHLFSYSPIHLFTFKKVAFTKPSRGTSEARDEFQSTKMLNFWCWNERCRLTRGAAFTLAEVLITLAIIGVVATMTLPTLIQNHQKRSLEVATQKFYSTMSQAIRQYMADQGSDDLRNTPIVIDGDNWETDKVRAQKEVDEFFKKYLKAQICENGCFAKNYKTQKDEVSYAVGTETQDQDITGRYLLPDGMVVELSGNLGFTDFPGTIHVDVNGQKGPNKIGYDLWSMSVFYDGTLDESGVTPECKKGGTCFNGTPSESRQDRFEWCLDSSPYGGCFGHFLENNFKFDY